MRSPIKWLSSLLLTGTLATLSAATPPAQLSLAALEKRLADIDGQLAQLANYNLRGGVGAIGSRSQGYDTAEQEEWIEI